MSNELIVVRQLPVIEDQLRQVKSDIQQRVQCALSLACTEDTYKEVKRERAQLSKEYRELEARRIEVKKAILAPYEQFEKLYKECAGDIYSAADRQLKEKISAVENGIKQQKAEEVIAYYEEYRMSLGIDAEVFPFTASGITVKMSDSMKSLKDRAKEYLDRISDELKMIDAQEYRDEILVEYRRSRNAAGAILTVTERHKAMEAEAARRAEAERQKAALLAAAQNAEQIVEEESIQIPVAVPTEEPAPEPAAPEDPVLTVAFTVTAPRSKLIALRNFLREGGYEYGNA